MQALMRPAIAEWGFTSWIQRFPASTIKRLQAIQNSTTSSRHIILTLAYGLTDFNIAKLNALITRLMVRRMQAERVGDSAKIEQIEQVLTSLHKAIDQVTGIPASKRHAGTDVCRTRTNRGAAKAVMGTHREPKL